MTSYRSHLGKCTLVKTRSRRRSAPLTKKLRRSIKPMLSLNPADPARTPPLRTHPTSAIIHHPRSIPTEPLLPHLKVSYATQRANTSDSMEQSAAEREARDYLSSLLNKHLRVTSTDGRIFWGQFKCIDPVRPSQPVCSPTEPLSLPSHPSSPQTQRQARAPSQPIRRPRWKPKLT